MWVKLKDGEHRCVDNEFCQFATTISFYYIRYIKLIRECEYTNIVDNCIEANNMLYNIIETEEVSEDAYERIADVLSSIVEYIYEV